jgi:bifunctional UDP-N-acetylglucosamine pyrophosphorylase/glucosamine-1-phosphate N-acetyltransferase
MCFKKDKLQQALRRVSPDNRKKEYYLTDVIGVIYKSQGLIESLNLADTSEALGINSRKDLATANRIMQSRINEKYMLSGVSIVDPASTFIGYGARIGKDTVIYPFTVIQNNVKIGTRCSVGPFAHLRAGTDIQDDVVVGNFLEISRSKISSKTWARHFGYLGDSRIGASANIGAGTVTANFDGRKKHVTVIRDKAFVGSDSVLVAPVEVGKSAVTGAGSVVLKNVKAGAVVAGVPAKPLKRRGKNG